MNYFPFIDFVALQSHIDSLSYFLHFLGSPWGVLSTWRVPQRQKGPDFSPEKAPAGPQANRCVARRLPPWGLRTPAPSLPLLP